MSFLVVKTDGMLPTGPEQLAQFDGLDVNFVEKCCLTEESLIDACRDADGILALREPFSARVLSELRQCKVIGRFGVGLDTIDVPVATKLGIRVTNVPDSNIEEVSTHAVAMMLSLVRRLTQFDQAIRDGRWSVPDICGGIPRLSGQTLGVVGFGRIGREMARKSAAFGVRVLAFDPHLDDAFVASHGAEPVILENLVRRSDIVSLHIPFTPENKNMFSRERLLALRRGAILINVSRGGLIDEAAAAELLASGHLAGIALDTFASEPIDSKNPLLKSSGALLSSHVAHYSETSFAEVRTKAFADVARILRGESPVYGVN